MPTMTHGLHRARRMVRPHSACLIGRQRQGKQMHTELLRSKREGPLRDCPVDGLQVVDDEAATARAALATHIWTQPYEYKCCAALAQRAMETASAAALWGAHIHCADPGLKSSSVLICRKWTCACCERTSAKRIDRHMPRGCSANYHSTQSSQ